MRYQIPLVAVMVVAIAATLGITTISATNLIVQNSPATEHFGMMVDHVELILRNADGNIISYYQGDNAVTDAGDRCASERLFKANSGDNGGENCGNAEIVVIGIANGTAISEDDSTSISSYGVADTTTGIMATIPDTVVTIAATGTGVATIITNSGHLFNFEDTGNKNATTTIISVILADAACGEDADGQCTSIPADMEVFAARDASLTVNDGDTLQVTWTITVGGVG